MYHSPYHDIRFLSPLVLRAFKETRGAPRQPPVLVRPELSGCEEPAQAVTAVVRDQRRLVSTAQYAQFRDWARRLPSFNEGVTGGTVARAFQRLLRLSKQHPSKCVT